MCSSCGRLTAYASVATFKTGKTQDFQLIYLQFDHGTN